MSKKTIENMIRIEEETYYEKRRREWDKYDKEMDEYYKKMSRYRDYEKLDYHEIRLVEHVRPRANDLLHYLELSYSQILDDVAELDIELPSSIQDFQDLDMDVRQEYVAGLVGIARQLANEACAHESRANDLEEYDGWDYVMAPYKLFRALDIASDYASYRGDKLAGTVIYGFLARYAKLSAESAEEARSYLDAECRELHDYHAEIYERLTEVRRRLLALAYYLEDLDRPEEPVEPERPRGERPRSSYSFPSYKIRTAFLS